MTSSAIVRSLTDVCGTRHVITGDRATERFRQGFRSGDGEATAVVQPGSLVELWRVLEICVAEDAILIMQAANTGLTEGSTPKGSYDRPVIIISTLRLDQIHVIKNGHQIISHPGATLYKLEKLLAPFDRQPHSVIGSSCIGASIMGGVCNNSGGSLVQRGPAFTELSVHAQLTSDGRLRLVNHLGIDLGETPEEILSALDRGNIPDAAIRDDFGRASDDSYPNRVRDIDAESPARFNADTRTLHEASGCAGKLAVFAVRLDTFPTQTGDKVYYVGTNDESKLTALRRSMLADLPELPISGEYLHRDCFDIARKYGKDTLLMIHWFGTDRLPLFFTVKGKMDSWLNKMPLVPKNLVDRAMQLLARMLPEALPKRMLEFREQFEHHLILKVSGKTAPAVETMLSDVIGDEGWYLCDEADAKKAMLHRFAAAGAAVRYEAVHPRSVETILALDIALRRNDREWVEQLPPEIEDKLIGKLYYGHFFCHVFHQDYIVKKGVDAVALKKEMLAILDHRGAEYPAEHNVGHLYEAKPALREFYESLDPTNSFNPGIGKTSKERNYGRTTGQNESVPIADAAE
ncbi:MAG: D-lactate dehydrogenase [Pseudomonadota bacterium]